MAVLGPSAAALCLTAVRLRTVTFGAEEHFAPTPGGTWLPAEAPMSDLQSAEQHRSFAWISFLLAPALVVASTVMSLASMA